MMIEPEQQKNGVPALVVVVGACVYIIAHAHVIKRVETPRVRARLNVLTVWTIAMIAWPLMWYNTIDEKYRTIESIPCLLWPLILLGMDIASLKRSSYESQSQSKRSLLAMDANTICSLTFAVSSVIGAQRHECCRKIFMYAIIACIAFVIPAPHSSDSDMDTIVIEAAQKAILSYATGFLLGGIMLTAFKEEE